MSEKELEKEADEYVYNWRINKDSDLNFAELVELRAVIYKANKDGIEFGYNKAMEDVKHDLMMKLKDEGIIKPLKESIFRNERLSSQEQQELCAWIECAMEFGENLDECAKENEELKKQIEICETNADTYYDELIKMQEQLAKTTQIGMTCSNCNWSQYDEDEMCYCCSNKDKWELKIRR